MVVTELKRDALDMFTHVFPLKVRAELNFPEKFQVALETPLFPLPELSVTVEPLSLRCHIPTVELSMLGGPPAQVAFVQLLFKHVVFSVMIME
jgi:hypothetical protein